MQIVADARWLTRAVTNLILFLAVLLLGVYLAAGKWWAIAAAVIVLVLLVTVWRAIRR